MKPGDNGFIMNPEQAWNILENAEIVCDAESVSRTIAQLAAAISLDYHQRFPLVLSIMNGGMVFAGQLLPQLHFPLSCSYIHATRYRNTTQGGELDWLSMPAESVAGRTVLLLDDILDEGHTLLAIKQKLLEMGATEVACAVLTNKLNGLDKPVHAEYVGMDLPNRYVFGCGMDIHGIWRNLPAIYALKEDHAENGH